MEVLLLGTGSASGWPEPGCRCATCASAAGLRLSRAPTCALVDDVLLLDPTQELARQAAQAGRTLSQVQRVLLSGARPHLPPAALLESWGAGGRVEVIGPPLSLQPYASLCAGESNVHLVAAVPGDVFRRGDHVLRSVGQGNETAWEVAGAEGGRLLYAPGDGDVYEAAVGNVETPAYDAVLLGASSFPAQLGRALGRLRGAGAVGDATDVIVVGIGHHAGLPDVLAGRLAGWGARAVPDGTPVHVGDDDLAASGGLRGRTLVLGGARSGKSACAEQLMSAQPAVTYVATGGSRHGDAEWRARVAAHVARRPATWRTVETTDVASCLRTADSPLLVDCLGTWLTARLDEHGVWQGAPTDAVERDVAELVCAWREAAVPVVAVSNEVGSGVVPATPSGRLFRDLLGSLNAAIAAESETVLLAVAGIAVPLRVPSG